MRRFSTILLFLGLIFSPFCPLPIPEAQAASMPHDMQSFSMPQQQGNSMPCCWSASDSNQTDDRAPVQTFTGPAIGSGFPAPAFSAIDVDSSIVTQRVFISTRTKFESRSSIKRE